MRRSPWSLGALRFDDTKLVFSSRTTPELIRAAVVFRAAGIPFVVRNSKRLVKLSYKVLGSRLTEAVLRATFFGHFCGGTDLKSVTPTVHKLEALGIGSILDYAAEKDVDSESAAKTPTPVASDAELTKEVRSQGVISARTFSYEGEESCEENKEIFKRCIDHVAASSPNAFAAIKVTALGRPELLRRISDVLIHTKRVFIAASTGAAGGGKRPDTGRLGTYRSLALTREQLVRCLASMKIAGAEGLVGEVWSQLDTSGDGRISFEEWMTFMQPSNPWARHVFVEGDSAAKPLAASEVGELEGMVQRLEEIAGYAATKKVRLMIDAEQTYFQDAIDLMVKGLQRRYNTSFPSIYNTYQCYLRNALSRVESDMRLARQQGWIFAAKIVRGAYMVQERELAEQQKVSSPIWPTIDETHASYESVASAILANIDHVAVMFATHNEDTVKKIVDTVEGQKLDSRRVAFGQLLGMCDHVSLTLGKAGFLVYKYVPYGPIREVVPYLIRRAEENSTILGSPGVLRERQMIFRELRQRLLGRKT
jgi:proline dehydrogenase